MSPRAREWLGRLALAAGSCGAVLLTAEIGLRAARFNPLAGNVRRRLSASKTVGVDAYPSNPRGYFHLDFRDPATRERYAALGIHRIDILARSAPYGVDLRFNSRLCREGEFGPRRAGVRRVVVIGDSFTEGQGVRGEDTYPKRLEALLNAVEPGRWEVWNCGRRGVDFPELFQIFRELLAFDPDIVVYGMVLNDPAQSRSFHARQAYVNDWIMDRGHMAGAEGEREPPLLESRLVSFVRDRLERRRVGRETTRWYREIYGAPNREGWEETQGYIREMRRTMRERGGAFLLVSWPLLIGLEGEYPFAGVSEEIARFCREAGIPQRDLLPVFRGRSSTSLWVHPLDMHPNEIAHRLAAEDLLPAVRALAPAERDAPATDQRRGESGRSPH